MHPLELYVKQILLTGNITADEYNKYLFPCIEQGIIKDISPKTYIAEQYQVIGAVVEFSDGSKFRITIWNPPDIGNPDNKYNYKSEVKRIDNVF